MELLKEKRVHPIVALIKLFFDFIFLILKGVIMRLLLPYILYGIKYLFEKLKITIQKILEGGRQSPAGINFETETKAEEGQAAQGGLVQKDKEE